MAPGTRRKLLIGAAIFAVPVLAVGWWLFSPLLFDDEVDEAFPTAANSADDLGATGTTAPTDLASTSTSAAAPPETTSSDPDPEPEPLIVKEGIFRDADSFHQGSGRATIYQLEDGSEVLRLEDFEVTNGPDLHVYLVPHPDPAGPDDVTGYVDLGALKGNIGNQNYEIPSGVDVGTYESVVIYCEPFHVVFSVAGLDS